MTATTTRAAETWRELLRCQREGVPAFPWALDFAQDGYGDLAEACDAVEAVAQAHLDAHPDDHGARRLLGEWLTACGDARGEGYQGLAACRRYPHVSRATPASPLRMAWWTAAPRHPNYCVLPRRWFDLTRFDLTHCPYASCFFAPDASIAPRDWVYPRQAAEDAAALAFLLLPESRRAQLLKGEM